MRIKVKNSITIIIFFFLLISFSFPFFGFYLVYTSDFFTQRQQEIQTAHLAQWTARQIEHNNGDWNSIILPPPLFNYQRIRIFDKTNRLVRDSGWKKYDEYNFSAKKINQPRDHWINSDKPESTPRGIIEKRIIYFKFEFEIEGKSGGCVIAYSDKMSFFLNRYATKEKILDYMAFSILLIFILLGVFYYLYTRPLIILKREIERKNLNSTSVERIRRKNNEIGFLSNAYFSLHNELERENRLYKEFTSDLLHELKNPLSGIINGLDELRENSSLLPTLKNESIRMQKMLFSIQELSRFETLDYRDEETDLLSVIQNIFDFYHHPGIIFYNHSSFNENERPKVAISPDDWGRVLRNLIDNALDFSGDKASIIICLKSGDRKYLLSIKDNGPGIPANLNKKIFKRFYSERKNNNSFHSGLGLAISQKIVEAAEGKISLKNNSETRGACFLIELPFRL